MAEAELGTIIATAEGPSTREFSFIVKKEAKVGIGKFVKVKIEDEWVYGCIADLIRTNRYFLRTDSVWEYERSGGLSAAFPTEMWEYSVARVKMIGALRSGVLRRPRLPPSPGQSVLDPTGEEVGLLIGADEEGLEIGEMEQGVSVRLNPTRLLQKHLAILAMSGAGKSNCARVIVEELLRRSPEKGRPAVVIFDVHGEYSDLSRVFPGRVVEVKARKLKIGVPGLSMWHFREFVPEMSGSQARELAQILSDLKSSPGSYDLEDVLDRLRQSEGMNRNLRSALEGWIFDLLSLGVFGREDEPEWESTLAPGRAVVVNMGDITGVLKKQVILAFIVSRLFHLRRCGLIPPTVLLVEEAHTFAPTESAVSKHVLETVAREGRKFYISLVVISQRPVRLSTTLLSQAGTNIILRITNPYDLEHIKKSSEMIAGEMADAISGLAVGEALVVGEAVNFPIFVRIRRSSSASSWEPSFEEAAKFYEASVSLSRAMERTEMKEHPSRSDTTSAGSTCSSAYSSSTFERST